MPGHGRISVFTEAIDRYFHLQDYVERPWLARKVDEAFATADRKQVLIVGEPGSGKSAFVAHLAATRNCPRYFIRLDSLRGVSGLSARAFLISLGTQLYQKYGPVIFPRATTATDVSAAVTQGKAEVVGRFIDQLFTLPFLAEQQHDVRVRSLFASDQARVVGELIREVHDSTLSLDEATLLEVTVLDPLRHLYALDPQEQVLMLIDALDEAAQASGTAITAVIPHVTDAGFPPNLRLVMTSRRGDHLIGFHEGDRLYLDDFSADSERDIRAYVQKRLEAPPLANAAAKLNAEEHEKFVSEVATSSGANFLYVHHFFNEATARAGQGKSLSAIPVPRGLDEIYRFFAVARIKGDTERQDWKETYLPVLGILAVLREPVRRELLATLAHIELSDVEYVIARLKPFLDVVDDGDQDRYGFYHSSFRDYLLDSRRNRDWSLDGPKLHGLVADHFRPANVSWSAVDWRGQTDDYPYQHLAAHLFRAGRMDELHDLVATGGTVIGWAEAHFRKSGSYRNYLRDLEVAWNAAAGSPDCVALAAQYVLIEASIRSFAWNLSADLLEALGVTRYWSWSAVLTNLHQTPDSDRGKILNELLPAVPIDYLHEVMATVRTLRREDVRVAAIRRMSEVWAGPWSNAHATEAVAAAEGLRDHACRAQALAALSRLLPDESQMGAARGALKAAVAAAAQSGWSATWREILPLLPGQIIGEAAAIASEIKPEWARVHALADIAGHCDPSACADDLLSRIRAVNDTWARIEGLAQVLARLPASKRGWLSAYGIIRSYCVRDAHDRTRAVTKFLPLLGSRTRTIVAASVRWMARAVRIPEQRTRVLIEVLEHLPQRQRASCVNEAIGIADAVSDTSQRFELLLDLARKSKGDDDGAASRAAIRAMESFADRADRHRAIQALCHTVPDALLPGLFRHIKEIDDSLSLQNALLALAPRLPDSLIADVQSIVSGTEGELDRGKILAALAGSRSQNLRRWMLSTACAISTPYWRAEALVALAPKMAELLPKLRDAVLEIEDDYARANGLVPLLGLLPASERPGLVAKALSAARNIPYENTRGQRLAQLVRYVPPAERSALAAEALSWGRTIGDRHARLRELATLYQNLPATMKSLVTTDLLDSLKRMAGPFDHGWSSKLVAAGLSPEMSTEAQRAVLTHLCHGDPDPWYLLYDLIDNVGNDLIDDLVQETNRLRGEYARARVLARLAHRLPPESGARAAEEAARYASTHAGQGLEAQILVDLPDDVLGANELLLWNRLLQAAASTDDEATWTKLAARIPPKLVVSAKAATTHLRDDLRARVLCTLACQAEAAARGPMIEEALASLRSRINQYDARRQLIELAGLVPEDALPQFVKAAGAIGDAYPRAQAVIGIARAAPSAAQSGLARQAFAAINDVSNDGWRIAALTELAPVLPAELLEPAFDLVKAMHGDDLKVLGYSALGARAPSHPRFRAMDATLREKAVLAMRNSHRAPEIALNLALATTGAPQQGYIRQAMLTIGPEVFSWMRGEFYARAIKQWVATGLWQDQTSGQHDMYAVLYGLRFETRGALLESVASLAPPIAHFGGAEAVRRLFLAIENVGRWWA